MSQQPPNCVQAFLEFPVECCFRSIVVELVMYVYVLVMQPKYKDLRLNLFTSRTDLIYQKQTHVNVMAAITSYR